MPRYISTGLSHPERDREREEQAWADRRVVGGRRRQVCLAAAEREVAPEKSRRAQARPQSRRVDEVADPEHDHFAIGRTPAAIHGTSRGEISATPTKSKRQPIASEPSLMRIVIP